MKLSRIFGIILILIACVICFYVGGWLFLIGGIIDIVEAIKAGWIAKSIVIGLCKIIILTPLALITAYILRLLGIAMQSN